MSFPSTRGTRRRLALFAGLVLDCALLLGIAAPVPAIAQTFKTLYNFTCGNDGCFPAGPFLRDAQGTLYGTALQSGPNNTGNGSIYKLTASGHFTVLYNFPGHYGIGPDGADPIGGLISDAQGNLYGVTQWGGPENDGVAFELSPSGTFTLLHTFMGPPSDGSLPQAYLVAGPEGLFYGATVSGGSGTCRGVQGICGTAYSMDSSGTLTIIHNFQGGPTDGSEPWGNLLQDTHGNFYGVTIGGGDNAGNLQCGGDFGCGTIFELSRNGSGWADKVLYRFEGGGAGMEPDALAKDAQGNLYGATVYGGIGSASCPDGCGLVFELSTDGTYTELYRFKGKSDGKWPLSLVIDSAGNLYETAWGGVYKSPCSQWGCGVVFKLDQNRKFTVLHRFHGRDGADPDSVIFDESTRTCYGVTVLGGSEDWGTIFQLKP